MPPTSLLPPCRGCFLAGGITHRCLGIFRSYAGTVWFLSLIFIHGKSNADVGSDFLTNRMLCEKEAYSVVLWPVVYQAGSPKILTSKPRIHQRETSFKRRVHSQCSNRRVLRIYPFHHTSRGVNTERLKRFPVCRETQEKTPLPETEKGRKALPRKKSARDRRGDCRLSQGAEARDATTYQRLTRPRPVSNRT